MITNKPFSCVAWCSPDFAKTVLTELVLRERLQFFSFIPHKPEHLERKPHLHVYFVPNKKLDTDKLKELLTETVDGTSEGVSSFRSSKFYDWYYYGLHNRGYLRKKCLPDKLYHYSFNDFVVSNYEEFVSMVGELPIIEDFSTVCLEAITKRRTFKDLVIDGNVPLQQFRNCQEMYRLLALNSEIEQQRIEDQFSALGEWLRRNATSISEGFPTKGEEPATFNTPRTAPTEGSE